MINSRDIRKLQLKSVLYQVRKQQNYFQYYHLGSHCFKLESWKVLKNWIWGLKVGEGTGTNQLKEKNSSILFAASWFCDIGNLLFVVSEQDLQSLS